MIDRLISALKQAQSDLASSVLKTPNNDRPLGEQLAHARGQYAGLQNALDAIDRLLHDDHEKEQKL